MAGRQAIVTAEQGAMMKVHDVLIGLACLVVVGNVPADPKMNCEQALQGMGYSPGPYAFKKAGWLSKEKHIFDGTLICHVTKDGEIHSIDDNGVVVAEDGIYGQDALSKRDDLHEERRRRIDAEREKMKQKKKLLDLAFEETKNRIALEFAKKVRTN